MSIKECEVFQGRQAQARGSRSGLNGTSSVGLNEVDRKMTERLAEFKVFCPKSIRVNRSIQLQFLGPAACS
jgi:hypothetical protein